MTILVVDDDPVLAYGVQRSLEADGYSVLVALDGEAALRAAREVRLSLIILDLLMRHGDGGEVLRWLRADPSLAEIPILLLTPLGWESRDAGSPLFQNAVAKPFAIEELVSRVEALVGPAHPLYTAPHAHLVREAPPAYLAREAGAPSLWQMGPVMVDPRNFSLRGEQGVVRLTPTEFALLRCLMERAGEVVSVSELLTEVWGYAAEEAGPELVRAHVRNLRGKIRRVAGPARQILQTVPRHGYTLALGA